MLNHDSSLRSRRLFTLRAVLNGLAVALLAILSGNLLAAPASTIAIHVETGLDGTWKVGHPTLHRVKIESQNPIQGSIEITTVDGDGVPVTYKNPRWTFATGNDRTEQVIEVIAKHGRNNRPIQIAARDDKGNLLKEVSLSSSERGTSLIATQPWIVGIGTNLQLERASMRSARGALSEFSVSNITNASQLPSEASAYNGVDLLILSSSNEALNRALTDKQAEAVLGWVRGGGQLVLTLGEHAPTLVQQPSIAAMIPGKFVEIGMDCEPGPLESLLGSQQQIAPLKCAIVKLEQGSVDLSTVSNTRTRFPFLAKWAHGLGSVHYFASELDAPELVSWDTHPGLIKHLIKDQWEKNDGRHERDNYQSVDDLSGQLNSMLDRFPKLRLGNLGQLVLIASIVALIIGPFDYFVVARAWRRPRATWITLLFTSLACMGLIVGLTNAWKPDLPCMNFVEVVDVDFQNQRASGNGFAHCYSGRRGAFNILAHHRNPNAGGNALKPLHSNLDWLGQPGRGIGGFESSVASERGMPSYSLSASSNSEAAEMLGVGIPTAGTKGVQSSWVEPMEIGEGMNSLGTISGKDDLLEGSFLNPLDVDLLNGTLYFAGRAYIIPSRIRPNERVTIASNIPKDIARRLQRRTFVAGQEQGLPWDPADTESIDRLVELMCFHRSAGGPAYTGLNHRYLASLECTDLLKLERAVVFAEVAGPFTTWSLQRNGVAVQPSKGMQKTFVRLVLPVQNNSKSKTATRELTTTPGP